MKYACLLAVQEADFCKGVPMKRRVARENAFIAAFEESFHVGSIDEILEYSKETEEYSVDAFGEKLVRTMLAHQQEADALIEPSLKDWKLSRIPRVCRIVLELAVTEMLYGDEGVSIIINEAVEITKKFASEEDYQFVNGVLGSIARANFPENDSKGGSECTPLA